MTRVAHAGVGGWGKNVVRVIGELTDLAWVIDTDEGRRAEYAARLPGFLASMPALRYEVEDVIAEGDRVAVRLTSSATHTGHFMGMPASGKRYEIGEIHIFRIRDGRVSEHWHQADFMGMMKQLGSSPGG